MSRPPKKGDFRALNTALTADVVSRLSRAGRHSAVIAEAPPGAGKSTLTASVAKALVDQEKGLRLAIVTQTNEQADDLVASIVGRYRGLAVARMVGGDGPSSAIASLAQAGSVSVGNNGDDGGVRASRIVVSTARKWQYERSRLQAGTGIQPFPFALIDEAYQMRSDMLLGIADMYDTLFCVGDPGQLDPFTVIDDSMWKGLAYSPSRAALATLRQFHQDLEPLILPTSWRLPPSAAPIVSAAFYPFTGFEAGTVEGQRSLTLGKAKKTGTSVIDVDATLSAAA